MNEFGEAFDALIDSLRDEHAPLRATLIYRLSNPAPAELTYLRGVWLTIPLARRQLLLSRLAETSEVSFEVDFTEVALLALDDEDPQVRCSAIDTLWENEQPGIMRRMLDLLQMDESEEVRAAAAQALGRFVLAGELGTFSETLAQQAENALLEVCSEGQEPLEVQRRALESIAYSGRDEVSSLIEEALDSVEPKMQASAIFAMGRSADQRWDRHVLRALSHSEPEMRFEAARAAGELTIRRATPRLIEMLRENDREIKAAAIWSLGEIGGAEAQQALMDLADREDDEDLLEAIEDALNMAVLSSGEFFTYILASDDLYGDLDELDEFDELDELDDYDA